MNRETLVKTASVLKQISEQALAEYSGKREAVTTELNELMTSRKDVINLVGENNLQMMADNHKNHSMFMESVFTEYNPEVLVDTVLWVFRAYRSHGFNLTYWPAQLEVWVSVLKEKLTPETWKQIYPFYKWMIINIPVFTKLSEPVV